MAKRVMVVEDDALTGELLQTVLELDGHRVTIASNLAEARAVLATGRPEVAIVDAWLKNESGLDLVRELRRRPEWSRIKIIVASATDDASEAALAAGADAFVLKSSLVSQPGLTIADCLAATTPNQN